MSTPSVGDIWVYDNGEDVATYLILELEDNIRKDELYYPSENYPYNVHLLRLEDGRHFPEYLWPAKEKAWTKVA